MFLSTLEFFFFFFILAILVGAIPSHELEQAPGGGTGQGSLACCSPWGRKEWDMTERLNEDKVGVKVSHWYSDLHFPAH